MSKSSNGVAVSPAVRGDKAKGRKKGNDDWGSNPYIVTDPRHEDFEGMLKKAHREQVNKDLPQYAKRMRACDFSNDALMTEEHTKWAGASLPVTHHPYPGRLKQPVSHVERFISAPNLTCHMAIHGGSISWECCRSGDIVVRNAFTGEAIATFSVNDEIPGDDEQLAERERKLRMTDRRANRIKSANKRGQAQKVGTMPSSSGNQEDSKDQASSSSVYATAVQLLGESNYAAVLLNNSMIRVYDTINLVPISEISIAFSSSSSSTSPSQSQPAAGEGQPAAATAAAPERSSLSRTTKSATEGGEEQHATEVPASAVEAPASAVEAPASAVEAPASAVEEVIAADGEQADRRTSTTDSTTKTETITIAKDTETITTAKTTETTTTTTTANANTADTTTTTAKTAETEEQSPFGTILPLDTANNPLTFCVMQTDSAHVISIQFRDTDSLNTLRPAISIIKYKSYAKLGLRFVSAGADELKNIIYAGDDRGKIWSIDLQDMLVIDSLLIAPPPLTPEQQAAAASGGATGRVTTRSSTTTATARSSTTTTATAGATAGGAAGEEGQKQPTEAATAVNAFKDFIVAGSSKGRVVAFLKQPFGEKPVQVIDEEAVHPGAIVQVAPDERQSGFWCISEDGLATCWSLVSYEQIFSATVPVESLVKSCTVLPHKVSSKVWTITMSGINKVFMAESNSSHEEMKLKIDQMNSTIARQSDSEAEKLSEIKNAEQTLRNRVVKISDLLAITALKKILRTYYYTWQNFKIRSVAKRNRHAAADCMGAMYNQNLLRIFYLRMVEYMNSVRARKQRNAMVTFLLDRNSDILMRRFYNKMLLYVNELRAARRTAKICDAYSYSTTNFFMAKKLFTVWQTFYLKKLSVKKNERLAYYLWTLERNRLRSLVYDRWLRYMYEVTRVKRKYRLLNSMRETNTAQIVSKYYSKWAMMGREQRMAKLKRHWIFVISNFVTFSAMHNAYTKMLNYSDLKKLQRALDAQEEMKRRYKEALETYGGIGDKGTRLRRIRELLLILEELRRKQEELRDRLDELQRHNTQMKREIDDQREHQVEGYVYDLDKIEIGRLMANMAYLRSKVVHFEDDVEYVTKVLAKAKVNPVASFYAACKDISALVEEVLGPRGEDGAPQFGLTDTEQRVALLKFDRVRLTTLKRGIKNVAITFDALGYEDLSRLEAFIAHALTSDSLVYCAVYENMQLMQELARFGKERPSLPAEPVELTVPPSAELEAEWRAAARAAALADKKKKRSRSKSPGKKRAKTPGKKKAAPESPFTEPPGEKTVKKVRGKTPTRAKSPGVKKTVKRASAAKLEADKPAKKPSTAGLAKRTTSPKGILKSSLKK